MKVTVKNSDGTNSILDGSKNICLFHIDEEDFDDVINLINAVKEDPEQFQHQAIIVVADPQHFSESEVFNMIDQSIQKQPVVEVDLEGSYEKIEYTFHKMRRQEDLAGMKMIADRHPVPFGLAYQEYYKNVFMKRQASVKEVKKEKTGNVNYGPSISN